MYMKKSAVILCSVLLLFTRCSQPERDKGIKQTIATTAKQELSFAGVNYIVKDGIVTLSGNAPSEKDKTKVESKVKNMAGVKEVVNQIMVAPVVLTGDFPLKQSVDSVLMKYPTVQATVKDSVIAVQGTIEGKKAQELFQALQQLRANGVTNGLVVNNE